MDPAASNESLESEGQASSCGSSMKDQLPSTIQGRLDRAKQLKGEGNKCFKEKDWKRAIKKYHHALMYCKGITDKLDFIPGMAAAGGLKATEEEEREATAVTVAVTNNLAACLTQTEDWERVITHTTKVLKLQPNNVKALYRRGLSRLKLGLLSEAEEDLTAAKEIDPKDKDIKLRLQEILSKRKDYIEKEKEMYSAMFNSSN